MKNNRSKIDSIMAATKRFSAKKKLQINEAIWEEDMDIPIEHQNLVFERVKKARKDSTRLVDWDIASKELRK